MMGKKERKALLIKIQTHLRSGIIQGKAEQIIEAYRWLEDLLADHGVFVMEDELPKFPAKALIRNNPVASQNTFDIKKGEK